MSTERRSSRNHHSKRVSSKSRSSGSGVADLLKVSLISVASSLGGMLILSLLAAIITFGTKDPLSTVAPLSVILICITALASGFIACKLCKAAPLSVGLLSGSVLTLLILVVALFLKNGTSPVLATGTRVTMHIMPIPISSAGAFLGSLKPVKKRRRTTSRR